MRDSFVFYKSFYDAIKGLSSEIQSEIYTAIMEYSLYGNEVEDLKPIANSIFTLIKPQIEANIARYENGRKGGRPLKTETKPNNNLTETKHYPNVNDNVYDNVNDNFNVNASSSGKAPEETNKNDLSRIIKIFEREFDRKIVETEILSIHSLLKSHSGELILYALGVAVENGVKTIAYVRSILQRLDQQNIKTLDQAMHQDNKYRMSKALKLKKTGEDASFEVSDHLANLAELAILEMDN